MLAKRAAELGGQPWLVSFSGMADVLGWPKRPPLVADDDRGDVLASWAEHCGGLVPRQRFIPFADVRSLSPEDFVRVLAEGLMVSASPHVSRGILNFQSIMLCIFGPALHPHGESELHRYHSDLIAFRRCPCIDWCEDVRMVMTCEC